MTKFFTTILLLLAVFHVKAAILVIDVRDSQNKENCMWGKMATEWRDGNN